MPTKKKPVAKKPVKKAVSAKVPPKPEVEEKPKEKEEVKAVKFEDYLAINGEKKDEENFATWINKQVTDHPVVKKHHGKWKELIAWAEEGKQFSMWNSQENAVTQVKLGIRKKKVVINLLKPLIETIDGKLNFYNKIVGKPNSGEDKDIRGAQVATMFLDFNDYTVQHDEKMEDAKWDLLRPGTTCKRWFWDDSLEAAFAPGGKSENAATKTIGDVNCEVVPIFNVRPDPTAKSPKDLRWVIEIKECTRQTILDRYGKYGRVDNVLLDEIKENFATKHEGMFVHEDEYDKDEETFIVKMFTEKKNNYFKQGRHIAVVGNKVIYADKNKNPRHQLGYFFYFYKKNPYSFWGKGPLYYTQDIQREFNRMVSITSEHIEAWRPKMAVGKNALARSQALTVGAFEIVEVDMDKGAPHAINMPELSPQVAGFRDFLISSIDRVSNVHEVSYSRLPQYASRAPASLYQMMLEQENIKLSPMVTKTNKTLVEEAKYRLELMGQHYDLKRMVQITGTDKSAVIVKYHSAEDMASNYDVRLEVGISMNQSASQQVRYMLELWNAKVLQGEEDRQKIVNMINLGTPEHDIRSDMADMDRALRENQAYVDDEYADLPQYLNLFPASMTGGEEVKFMSFVWKHDDHMVHLDQHTTLMKGAQYSKLSEKAKFYLTVHIEEHHQYWSMEQAMAGGMAPGGQPGGGGAAGNKIEMGQKTPGPAPGIGGAGPIGNPGS